MDAARLIGAWSERDSRYACRWIDGKPAGLSQAEVDAIRTMRLAEASALPFGKGRAAAFAYVMNWRPPRVVEWRDPLLRLEAENRAHRRRYRRKKEVPDAEP